MIYYEKCTNSLRDLELVAPHKLCIQPKCINTTEEWSEDMVPNSVQHLLPIFRFSGTPPQVATEEMLGSHSRWWTNHPTAYIYTYPKKIHQKALAFSKSSTPSEFTLVTSFDKVAWKTTVNWKARLKRKCFAEKWSLSQNPALLCLASIFKILSERKKLFCSKVSVQKCWLVQCKSQSCNRG